jgi:hypothetical protein
MPIAAVIFCGVALTWGLWHLTYLLSGRARRDLDVRDRLRRYTSK